MRSDIYWIILDRDSHGRLAVSARPRGGDWLDEEVANWKRVGITHVVSLLTPSEARELELEGEASACAKVGITYTNVQVADRGVPSSSHEFRRIAAGLQAELTGGARLLIHCRQGIGRASIMAASVLAEGGIAAEAAFGLIAQARGRPVPDTPEQRTWVERSYPIAKVAA